MHGIRLTWRLPGWLCLASSAAESERRDTGAEECPFGCSALGCLDLGLLWFRAYRLSAGQSICDSAFAKM